MKSITKNEQGIPLIDTEPLWDYDPGLYYLIPKDLSETGSSYYLPICKFYTKLTELGVTSQEYYDRYFLGLESVSERPTCPYCGNNCFFQDLNKGYSKYCSRSCQVSDAWENDDGSRREAQRELGREIMDEVNSYLWTSPDYEEFRRSQAKKASIRMTQMNYNNWSDPDYIHKKTEEFMKMMSDDPHFRFKGQRQNFLNYGFKVGIFYIIINQTTFKIGISNYQVNPLNYRSHLWSKLWKYGSNNSIVFLWHGTDIQVADLEFYFKVNYQSTKESSEIFNIELLDSFLDIIDKSSLIRVED